MSSRALMALAVAAFLTACDLGTVVEVVQVANIQINPTSEPVQMGNSIQLQTTATSARGEPLTRDLNFSSSNASIAGVSSSGLVNTTGPGTVLITAASGSVSAAATIHSVPFFCPITGTLRPGDSDSGDLVPNSCTSSDFNSDFWFLEITDETSVQIDLTSNDVDSFLVLLEWINGSNSFRLIDTNDDGGSGVNSRLTLTLTPGIYVIGATTFLQREAGSYQVSVS